VTVVVVVVAAVAAAAAAAAAVCKWLPSVIKRAYDIDAS
jgi:phospholipase C